MNLLLYALICVIWGMTWLAIKMQLGTVPIIWSLIYRFSLAAAIFFLISFLKGNHLRFSVKYHFMMATLGLFLFGLNYILFYIGSSYLISGLVAVTAASLTILNVVNSRLFLKTPISPQVTIGSVLGLLGLVIIFYANIHTSSSDSFGENLLGLVICLIGSYSASIGNMIAAYNKRHYQIPVLTLSAYGMFYGCIFMLLVALLMGQYPVIDLSIPYIGSLLYLSLPGTVFAFYLYLILLERIGPERVGYVFIITPIIALLISSWFELFAWTHQVLLGITLVLMGNGLVLYKKKMTKKPLMVEAYE